MSLIPSKFKDPTETVYAFCMMKPLSKNQRESGTAEEGQFLIGRPARVTTNVTHRELAELVVCLFNQQHHTSHQHPKTNPKLPPVKRGKRHRDVHVWQLNQFRHWWKTSRLLVRLSGATICCQDAANWGQMAVLDVNLLRHAKVAAKMTKRIGQGGPLKPWLSEVHPYTRTLRIIIAIARAIEAKVDNRFYEVGLAEGFAFIGNRCCRYWTRHLVDWLTVHVALPFAAIAIAPYIDQGVRPMIVAMGLLRAVLPFVASFQGSRLGRQLTFNTYKFANYRWKAVQSIMQFHESTGTYQDTNLDQELLSLARKAAEQVGHGSNPSLTRLNLARIGFQVFGSGCGGHSIYRMIFENKVILLHLTPYGPSILDELPFYILLERRRRLYTYCVSDLTFATILDAATPREAHIQGFLYSGAFFQGQEWAALKKRFTDELEAYATACQLMNTKIARKRHPSMPKVPVPPTDLRSLKEFIKTGRKKKKQKRDMKRWVEVQAKVKRMSQRVAKYQETGNAPTRVILYLEGLDCAGKSSTGGLICSALEKCGYDVKVAQHNRPPTPEQRKYPWMHRIRFEYPEDMYTTDERENPPNYAAIVWDRGPVGDFVYGKLNLLSTAEKIQRYKEFREYDYRCKNEDVLFCKIFFVTDRDSIAKTLGKRLAHKQIAKDLRTWLDFNSVEHLREGLDEIENHIDPTDFVAFNRYEENIKRFSEVVRNTDYAGRIDSYQNAGIVRYHNPWLVVNTSDRHSARVQIMDAFIKQIERHATIPMEDDITNTNNTGSMFSHVQSFLQRKSITVDTVDEERQPVPDTIVEEREHGLSLRAICQIFLLSCLFYAYANQTWNFELQDIT